jgi:hypothetical protein
MRGDMANPTAPFDLRRHSEPFTVSGMKVAKALLAGPAFADCRAGGPSAETQTTRSTPSGARITPSAICIKERLRQAAAVKNAQPSCCYRAGAEGWRPARQNGESGPIDFDGSHLMNIVRPQGRLLSRRPVRIDGSVSVSLRLAGPIAACLKGVA